MNKRCESRATPGADSTDREEIEKEEEPLKGREGGESVVKEKSVGGWCGWGSDERRERGSMTTVHGARRGGGERLQRAGHGELDNVTSLSHTLHIGSPAPLPSREPTMYVQACR